MANAKNNDPYPETLNIAPGLDASEWLRQLKKKAPAAHAVVVENLPDMATEILGELTEGRHKAYGYVRVSHDDSVQTGGGLEHQIATATAYIEFLRASTRPDITFGGVFKDEIESAWKKQLIMRPAGKRLNSILKRGDIVVITRIDRGFRNLGDCLNTLDNNWGPRGVSVIFLEPMVDLGTPYGRLVLQVSCAFAEMESGVKSLRTREALQSQKKRGYGYCRPKWGYRHIGPKGHKKIVPDLRQRRVGQYCLYLKAQGKSQYEISKLVPYCEQEVCHLERPRLQWWENNRVHYYLREAGRMGLEPLNWIKGEPDQPEDSKSQDSIQRPASDAQSGTSPQVPPAPQE